MFIRSHYTKILNAIADDLWPTLTNPEQSAYFQLYRLAYGNAGSRPGSARRTCKISVRRLGERCNLGETAMRRALRGLEGRGLVVLTHVDQRNVDNHARGMEFTVHLPDTVPDGAVAGSFNEPASRNEAGSRGEPMKENKKRHVESAPVAVAPAPLSVYDVRKIVARFAELNHGDHSYTRAQLRADVLTALQGQGAEVGDELLDQAIGA